jgi:uncharacterized membrane protein YfcA
MLLKALAALAAGFGGGAINTVAGGGTNLTFPTLLWLGVDPVLASSTSTLCLWLGQALGALAYRQQIAQAPRGWLWFCLPAALGGALGGWLLIQTPSQTFRFLVPYLVLGGSALLALEPLLRRRLRLSEHHRALLAWRVGAGLAILAISVYGGYFGAGMGILMLAALGLLGVGSLQAANAFKNLFGALLNLAAIAYFLAVGAVVWTLAGWMILGSAAGGYLGAKVAGRIPDGPLRLLMVALGLGVGLLLLF